MVRFVNLPTSAWTKTFGFLFHFGFFWMNCPFKTYLRARH